MLPSRPVNSGGDEIDEGKLVTTEIWHKAVDPFLEFSAGQQVSHDPQHLGPDLLVAPLKGAEQEALHLIHLFLHQPLRATHTGGQRGIEPRDQRLELCEVLDGRLQDPLLLGHKGLGKGAAKDLAHDPLGIFLEDRDGQIMFLEQPLDPSLDEGERRPREEEGHRDVEVVEDLPQLGVVGDLMGPADVGDRGEEKAFHQGAEDNVRAEAFRCILHEMPKRFCVFYFDGAPPLRVEGEEVRAFSPESDLGGYPRPRSFSHAV